MLAYDPWLHTPHEVERFRGGGEKAGAELRALRRQPARPGLAGSAGAADRPGVPHPERFAGESAASKRTRHGAELLRRGRRRRSRADDARIRSPGCSTSAAATCRIRRCRCPSRPAPGRRGRRCLSTGASSSPASSAHLGNAVTVSPPERLGPALDALAADRRAGAGRSGERGLLGFRPARGGGREDPSRAPIPACCPRPARTPVEIDGTRAAHRRDGAALTRFLAWLAREAPPAAA